jgi:hypothetical protein
MPQFQSNWTPEEIARAKELVKHMSCRDAAQTLTIEFKRHITRSAVIGKLNRIGHHGPEHMRFRCPSPNTKGISRARKPKKPGLILVPHTRYMDDVEDADSRNAKFGIRYQKAEPRYEPEWTCQYIGPDDKKCNVKCRGSWCEEHKKIVYMRKVS